MINKPGVQLAIVALLALILAIVLPTHTRADGYQAWVGKVASSSSADVIMFEDNYVRCYKGSYESFWCFEKGGR